MAKRRAILLAATLTVLLSSPVFAELRVDVGVDVPWGLGAAVSDLSGSTQSANVNILKDWVFLWPEGSVLYQMPVGPMNFGIGVRAFTFLIETVMYPNLLAELNLGPVAVDLNFGGGAFLFFGLFNQFSTGSVWIPDLSAYFKIGKVFRIGVGGAIFYSPELYNGGAGVLPYMVYLAGRLSFSFF